MTETVPPPKATLSPGQELYTWLTVHGHKAQAWPRWEQLTLRQQAILDTWAAQFRASLTRESRCGHVCTWAYDT